MNEWINYQGRHRAARAAKKRRKHKDYHAIKRNLLCIIVSIRYCNHIWLYLCLYFMSFLLAIFSSQLFDARVWLPHYKWRQLVPVDFILRMKWTPGGVTISWQICYNLKSRDTWVMSQFVLLRGGEGGKALKQLCWIIGLCWIFEIYQIIIIYQIIRFIELS